MKKINKVLLLGLLALPLVTSASSVNLYASPGNGYINKYVSGGTGTFYNSSGAPIVGAAAVGDVLTYHYELRNYGDGSAPNLTGMTLVDPLDDTELDLATASGLTMEVCDGYGGTATCTPYTVPSDGSATIDTNGLNIAFGSDTLMDCNSSAPGMKIVKIDFTVEVTGDQATFDAGDDAIDTTEYFSSNEAGNQTDFIDNPPIGYDIYKDGVDLSTGGGNTGGGSGSGSGGGSHHSGGGSNSNADGGSFTIVSPDGDTTEGKNTTTSSDSTSNDSTSTNTEGSKTAAKWGSEEETTTPTTDSTENKVVDETNEGGKTPVIWEM